MLEGEASAALWREVRDVSAFAGRAGDVWRLSLVPSAAAGVVADLGGEAVYDWGGGLVWLLDACGAGRSGAGGGGRARPCDS